MQITNNRKRQFSDELLNNVGSNLGFIDVGSGGSLKYPWNLLPADKVSKFDFEPTGSSNNNLPLCVSNKEGETKFNIAFDERASSLQTPSEKFISRFGRKSNRTSKTIDVRVNTLDNLFRDKFNAIDFIDINVEGHDFQVLEGAEELLKSAGIKLLKIEFELTEVWQGQGWFSDIDFLLRKNSYELANIEIDFGKPLNSRHIYYKGEPLWGKAYYVLSGEKWKNKISGMDKEKALEEFYKAAVLYIIMDLPARGLDLLSLLEEKAIIDKHLAIQLRNNISRVYDYQLLDNIIKRVTDIFNFIMKK